MSVLPLPDSALSGGRPVNTVNNASSFEVEWNVDQTRFRVKVGLVYYGWFVETASNTKAVLVFFREMYDSRTGRRLFTEAQRAALLGSTNRQAVDGHMKGFREADGDIGKFLSRTRNVDADVEELVWKTGNVDPYTSLSTLTIRVNAVYDGDKPLNTGNVREALSGISGYRLWLLNDVEKGRAHSEEPFLIDYLLGLLSEQTPDSSKAVPLPEGGDVSELTASAAQGETSETTIGMSKQVVQRVEALFSPSDASQMETQIAHAWEGGLGLMLLACAL